MCDKYGFSIANFRERVLRMIEDGFGEFGGEGNGVPFWMELWSAVRLEERLVQLEDLADFPFPDGLDMARLEDILQEEPTDFRFHLSSGALESFVRTLPLLHPRGYLQVFDIFVTDMAQYRTGFFGPGKLDGSLLNWVNGALLKEVARREGYDVHSGRSNTAKTRKLPSCTPLAETRFRTTFMTLPILPTAIVGSYSMPHWLERLKGEYFSRRISGRDLDEIYDAAVKAAIKDQEIAGIDIVTDGELRRDNMVDYFIERFPGVQIDRTSKKFYYDFYDTAVRNKLPMSSLGVVHDFTFLRQFTDRAANSA